MTTATDMLRNDHEFFLRTLETAEAVARQLDQGKPVDPATLAQFLEFFRLIIDRSHHGKEEDLLFPLLGSKGLPRNGGPVGVMLQEHDMGRALIRQMVEASDDFAAGKEGSGQRWAASARDYAALLRAHIQKENNILFVMAERILSDSEQAQLLALFQKIEGEKVDQPTRDRLYAAMEKLEAAVKSS
jgi:hemerythrin-like domain-containing protein